MKMNENDDIMILKEPNFNILVELLPNIVARYNLTLRCTYVNKAWETITGYPKFEMLDKTPEQNVYLPREVTQRIEEVMRMVIQTKQGIKQEFMLPNAITGLPVYLLVDVVPELGLNRQVIGILVVARDISTLKRYENDLKKKQDILEEAQRLGHIGSWELDLVTNTREWSTETYRIFEMNPYLALPSNDAFMRLVHHEDREGVEKVYRELDSTSSRYEVEFRLMFPDGRVKYVYERGITKFDNNGNAIRYVGTVQDVTQWKLQEQELIHAREMAEESSRMKSSFLAMMSHEIRTPLNAILGFTSLLSDISITVEERDEFISLVELGAARLTSAIDSIIELSKLISGDIKINSESYSPEKVIKQQYKMLRDLCIKQGKAKLRVSFEIDSRLRDLDFKSDAARITQTINILVNNAVKYTKSGEIILGVKCSVDKLVTYYVSDTGIGITPEKQKTIFGMFSQVEDTYKRNFEGLGIGLSAARQLVHALGGDITLVSELGKGSVFSFTIPIKYASGVRYSNISAPVSSKIKMRTTL